MNDVCEHNKNIYKAIDAVTLKAVKKEIYRYEQISLTTDLLHFGRKGFDLHQMWGIYADNGYGVCLCFDKLHVDEALNKNGIKTHRHVEYKSDFSEDLFLPKFKNDSLLKEWVEKNAFNLFFTKRKEWEHEQEYRIINRFEDHNNPHFLNIKDSIRYVILSNSKTNDTDGPMNNSIEYKLVKYCLPLSTKILFYGSFDNQYSLSNEAGQTIWNESCEIPFINGEQIDKSELNSIVS